VELSKDRWLEEQIEQYRMENAASAAFYHQAAGLLSARQLLVGTSASRHRRVRSPGRLLHATFHRLRWRGRQTPRYLPTVLEGVVIPTPMDTDEDAQTVIVIGVSQQTKGE